MPGKPVIDISPAISPRLAVWPGDVAFKRQVQLDMAAGANLTLSSLSTTVHLGAHADAPSHFSPTAPSIDEVDLAPYIGPCAVITCSKPRGSLIEASDVLPALTKGAKRILVRTLSYPDPHHFNTDFVAFSPDAIDAIGQAGALLVGIDTPSVDPYASKDLQAHNRLLKWGIRNLEGLCLSHVADGDYELIALPLKLVGFDASPVRAVLRPY